jgi:chloramphenicol-sensitive protein RarD
MVIRSRRAAGVAFALLAYVTWGIVPLYWKLLAAVAPIELVAHRIVWALVVVGVLSRVAGTWHEVGAALGDRAVRSKLLFSSVLIGTNWGLFIWAVATGRTAEASLGYFINPLMSVLLGVIVLGERLQRGQWIAVALAGLAVVLLLVLGDGLPWVALTLAVTFAAYGLVRKLAPISSLPGLFVESLVLTPIALGLVAWRERAGDGVLGSGDARLVTLVALSGLVTALPLAWFNAAARRLPLSTVGFFQYVSPTLQLLLAVYAFDEPVAPARWAAFALIWVALAIHSGSMLIGGGDKVQGG